MLTVSQILAYNVLHYLLIERGTHFVERHDQLIFTLDVAKEREDNGID